MFAKNIPYLIKTYYAKSDGTTIREHTDRLLENLKVLKQHYGEKIEKNIPKEFRENFWKLLELACEYHDYGKIHCKFQQKVGNKKVKCPPNLKEVKHNLLSPIFLYLLEGEKLSEDELVLISLAVLNHHRIEEKNLNPLSRKVEQVLKEEFQIKDGELLNFLKDILEDDEYQVLEKFFEKTQSVKKTYTLLKGFLLRLDHISSVKTAPVKVEIEPMNTLKVLKEKLKLNDLQKFVENNRDKNLLVVASTGYGKTEAGAIFLKKKGFFTLPVRTAVNAIYSRFRKHFGDQKVGLLHSSALSQLLEEKESETNRGEGILTTYYGAKQYSQPLIVSTPDQVLPFVFHYEGFEKVSSIFSYARIVLDEIQAYEPYTLAFIVQALKEITEMGGKFMVTTATVPTFLKEELQDLVDITAEFLKDTPRHNVKFVRSSILQNLDKIARFAGIGKVLVITNTVERTLELKRALDQKGIKANLLHSRFTRKDRKLLEEKIENFFHTKEAKGIWITTQLAEASLDLDADFLFTELSTADSLIQRMGRVNRFGKKSIEDPNVFIFLEDPSGVGNVYPKDLLELTLKNLPYIGEDIWNEEKKLQLVERVYSQTSLEGTKYLESFRTAKNYIQSVHKLGFREKKREAIKLFRNIFTVDVIPLQFKEEVELLSERYVNETDLLRKLILREQILDYVVSVPLYWKKEFPNAFSVPVNKKLQEWGIMYIDTLYGKEEGLIKPSKERENSTSEGII